MKRAELQTGGGRDTFWGRLSATFLGDRVRIRRRGGRGDLVGRLDEILPGGLLLDPDDDAGLVPVPFDEILEVGTE